VLGLPGALTAVTTAPGVGPSCMSNGQETLLQAGGQFWNGQTISAAPVQFAQGVFFSGGGGNPLGDLGPAGNPSNVVLQGQEGAWCVPASPPFSLSSPIENPLFWIALSLVVFSVLVFFLSRGFSRPMRGSDQAALAASNREMWHRRLRQA
jgi:hypothetical protein